MQPAPKYSPLSLMAEALEKRGYSVAVRLFGDRKCWVFTAPSGKVWISPVNVAWYPFVSAPAKRVSVDKYFAYEYADMLGVTIPRTLHLPADKGTTEQFLRDYSPLVVKPLNLHGGEGVTLDVTNMSALQAAMKHGQDMGVDMLLQQQVTGEEVRFAILNGEIATVFLRQTPRVVGDGHSTVAELVDAENKLREGLTFDYLRYPQLSDAIISPEKLHNQQVLAAGEVFELSKSTMIRGGASVYDITSVIHDSYKQTALKLASSLNPEFLVVDMMIQDYTQPQTDKNYAFIEFNTAPSLKLYYSARDGRHYDMVTKLADMVEARMK